MTEGFETFLALPQGDRRDVVEAAARHLDTSPSYVEKDFGVCLALDALFNHCPKGHPRLLFKGGTSLSKVFGLVKRFSEDIDLVVFRDDLGFEGERDPTTASNLSNKKRSAQFKKLQTACSEFIRGGLRTALARRFDQLSADCQVVPDESDHDGQTLLVEYSTLYPSSEVTYVAPQVKIEAGARSALAPNQDCTVTAYIAAVLPGWSFKVGGIRAIAPERTYWEKLLILRGVHCGFRDERRSQSLGTRLQSKPASSYVAYTRQTDPSWVIVWFHGLEKWQCEVRTRPRYTLLAAICVPQGHSMVWLILNTNWSKPRSKWCIRSPSNLRLTTRDD